MIAFQRFAAAMVIAAVAVTAASAARDVSADSAEILAEAEETYARALDLPERDARIAQCERAAALYRRLVEIPIENADLYTNLGNAALQAERLGEAVLAYKSALARDPDHARARQNLAHARTLLPEWIPSAREGTVLDTFFFWHKTLSRSERGALAALAFFAAALLAAGAIAWRRAVLRNLAWLPGVVWAALLASLLFESRTAGESAVVISEARGHAADSANAPGVFPEPLPAGAEVTVLERRGPWARIRLADGARDAWVAIDSLGFPPKH
ncbi:MAG: hypothetical protein L0Z55_08985 [Planctomycetes bacterium]|nr:hypothetical protein [Planctomycetota bacterium]